MHMPLQIAWKGKIESISQEGLGIGTIQNFSEGKLFKRPIFVPFTVPGDEVEVDINDQKRKYSFGDVRTILTPSVHRVIPQCPHFTVCGGCNLQHISYEEQVRQKASQIQFLLTRKGIKLPYDVTVLPAKQRHNYRKRAKIAIQFTGSRVLAGFRKFHAHDIVPVKICYIVAPEIVQLITLLNKMETTIGSTGNFTQEIIVVVGDSKKLGILVALDNTEPHLRKHVRNFFEDIYGRNRKLMGNLFFEENRVTKTSGQVQEHITYKAAGLTFSFLPETFIQSNVATNEALIETSLKFLGDMKDNVVLDLYAGLGNISLPIAKRAKSVIAVEGHEASVLLGRINAYQNGIENTLFIHRSTEKYLYEYVKITRNGGTSEEYPPAQKIIIDPPRTGCTPDVIKELLHSNIPSILYISCNPVTLSTDLNLLGEKYIVKEILGVDMFPDISHVETVVLLEKKQ
jgi:23S rRNA (uracil1939-C5)-methyltransferase